MTVIELKKKSYCLIGLRSQTVDPNYIYGSRNRQNMKGESQKGENNSDSVCKASQNIDS